MGFGSFTLTVGKSKLCHKILCKHLMVGNLPKVSLPKVRPNNVAIGCVHGMITCTICIMQSYICTLELHHFKLGKSLDITPLPVPPCDRRYIDS